MKSGDETETKERHICALLLRRIVNAFSIGDISIRIVANEPTKGSTRNPSMAITAIRRERKVLGSIHISAKFIWRSTRVGQIFRLGMLLLARRIDVTIHVHSIRSNVRMVLTMPRACMVRNRILRWVHYTTLNPRIPWGSRGRKHIAAIRAQGRMRKGACIYGSRVLIPCRGHVIV